MTNTLQPGDRVWTDYGLGEFVDYVPGENDTTLALVYLDEAQNGQHSACLDPAQVYKADVKREKAG
jgi:hypothetical protein